jgi:hypothetical protein
MASRITDQQTLTGIKKLIEWLQAEKAAPHPEQGSKAALVGRPLSCPLVAGNDAYWHETNQSARSDDVRTVW